MKFPIYAPKRRVIRTLELLGFKIVREREHIAMHRSNADGSVTHSAKSFDAQGFDASRRLQPRWNCARRFFAALRKDIARTTQLLSPPGRSLRTIFENHATRNQFIANAVGLIEIFRFAGGDAFRNERIDIGIG